MENSGDRKDPGSDEGKGEKDAVPQIRLEDRRTGLGPVARYLKEYGGVRRQLNKKSKNDHRLDDVLSDTSILASEQEIIQWRNFRGKYPQSVVSYCEFSDWRLRAMFTYLQEAEWVLQFDLIEKRDERTLIELRAIEKILIFVASNLSDGTRRAKQKGRE